MKILPILFNTEMVRAILDGRKTVTRRVVKLPKWIVKQDDGSYTMCAEGTCYEKQCFEDIATYLNRPYRRGDILYVRETWNTKCDNCEMECPAVCNAPRYVYRADILDTEDKWKPSLHMPKEAARIFLKVKDVRVERLQDMNEVDTAKEGIRTDMQTQSLDDPDFIENWGGLIIFKELWNSTIKKDQLSKYGWDANPWVWVIEFERCEKPENW